MNNTEVALLGYIAWFLILIFAIEIARTVIVLKTGRAANSFMPDGSDVSPLMNRLSRAHANCYEAFPFIGGLLLYSVASATQEVTNTLALWLLVARLAQSTTHLISTNPLFAQIRFLFFFMQIVIVCYWLIGYANKA